MKEAPSYVPGHQLLAGKSVLITAAAGAGIGFAAARKCAEEGCRALMISDIHPRRLEEAVAKLKADTGLQNVWEEAIISEIVDQDLEHRLALTEVFRSAASSRPALRAHIAGAVARQLDGDAAALKVEIVAEAGRNPRVAEIVRKADSIGRLELASAIRDIRRRAGHDDHPGAIDEMVELISAMYGGVLMRSITNPAVDANALADRIVKVIEATLYGDVPEAAPGGA